MVTGTKQFVDYEKLYDIQYGLFELIFKEKIKLNVKYKNPLRQDRTPGCWFYLNPNGVLYFVDPANKAYSGNALTMAKLCPWIDENSLDYNELSEKRIMNVLKQKKPLDIRVATRLHFSQEAIDFFLEGEIDITDSKYRSGPYKVAQVSRLKMGEAVSAPKDLCIAYMFPSGHKQIYRPRNKERKWRSNTTVEDVWGFDHENDLPPVITSSVKDALVLEELGYHAIAPKSETAPIDFDIIKALREKSEEILLVYDNDETGREQAEKLASKYELIPKFMVEKDPFDQAKAGGIRSVKQCLNT